MKKLYMIEDKEDCEQDDRYVVYFKDDCGNEFAVTYFFTDFELECLDLFKKSGLCWELDYTYMWREILCRKPDRIEEDKSVIEDEWCGEHEDPNNEYELYDDDRKTPVSDIYADDWKFFTDEAYQEAKKMLEQDN